MHLFAIELYITNSNNFLLLFSFIYYTSIFPLDERSFGEFSNTQTEKHKATNPKLISRAWIYHKVKNSWVPRDMSRCQTSFLRDVQASPSFQIYVCIIKSNRKVLEEKQHREELDSLCAGASGSQTKGVQRWRKGNRRNRAAGLSGQ